MLRLGLVVLGLFVLDQGSGFSINYENLIQRIKRSPHYWPPPPPPPPLPYWGPPGPPHWGPPGPPPHWGPPGPPPYWRHHHHHHHSDEDYNEYKTKETTIYEKKTLVKEENKLGNPGIGNTNIAQSNGIGFGQNNPGQSNPGLELGHDSARLVDGTQSIPVEQGNFVPGNIGPGNPPCDTCKGKSTAISNAQSVSGSAVAIAVSKSSNS